MYTVVCQPENLCAVILNSQVVVNVYNCVVSLFEEKYNKLKGYTPEAFPTIFTNENKFCDFLLASLSKTGFTHEGKNFSLGQHIQLTLLPSKGPKLHRVVALLSAKGLGQK